MERPDMRLYVAHRKGYSGRSQLTATAANHVAQPTTLGVVMSKSERCGVTAHNRFMRVGGVRWAVSAFAFAAAVCATFTTSSASAMHGTGRGSPRMWPQILAAAAALLLAPALAHAAPPPARGSSSVIEGRYIVVLKGTVADPGAQRREPHGSHMVVTLPAART